MSNRMVYAAIAILLIVGSLVLILVGKKGGSNKLESDRISFEGEEIKSLDLKIGACEIEIQNGNAFSLEYEDIVVKELSYSVKNGKLSVEYSLDKKWMKSLNSGNPKVILTIPNDAVLEKTELNFGAAEIKLGAMETKELILAVGAGEMKASGIKATECADIKVGAGELTLKNTELANVKMECGVGEITIDGVLTGKCNAKCGVGEIDITLSEKTQEDYGYNLKCGLGSVTFGDIQINGSGSKTYSSDAENRFDIDCGVGSVKVLFR